MKKGTKKIMINKMKTGKKNEKGFTLIELLVIVFIISLLAAALLVSISLAGAKAGDNAAFTSFKSTGSAAYMCLLSGVSGISLSTPTDISLSYLCMKGAVPVTDSVWPSLAKSRWIYGNGSFSGDGFFWCNLSNSPSPVSCGSLVDGVCGQSSSGGAFCYGLKNGSKSIWCTQDGCHKDGF